jgi:hypothetical protein
VLQYLLRMDFILLLFDRIAIAPMIAAPIINMVTAMTNVDTGTPDVGAAASAVAGIAAATARNIRIFNLYIAVLIVTALVLAFFTWLVWDAGNKVQDAIRADADARLETEKGKVAGLQKDAADAKATQQLVEIDLAKQQERTALAEQATLELQKTVAWRTVSEKQAAIIERYLAGKKIQAHIVVMNLDDPEQAAYFFSINNICLKLNITCWQSRVREPSPFAFPMPGVFSFAYEDADRTFIDALKAAGLVTGRVGTLVGSMAFPEGVRAGIIIGPKPNPLHPDPYPDDPFAK